MKIFSVSKKSLTIANRKKEKANETFEAYRKETNPETAFVY